MPLPLDNELYDHLASTWWDENEVLNLLRTVVNPGRFGYFRHVLQERLKIDLMGKQVLDVGCGGGLLAEEFAQLGCQVTGIDPSEPSVAAARAHAQQQGLAIDYRRGVGESLPFADASFDIVYCCDVLEHVADLEKVLLEIARVLKKDGIFFYDTINRTLLSKLISIKLLQEWNSTSLMPPNLHEWKRFIKPHELQTLMKRYGLIPQELTGLGPHVNPIAAFILLRKRKRGEMSYKEVGERAKMGRIKNTSNSYMGYATKG